MSEVGPGEAIEQKVALLVRAWLETKRKARVAEQERLHDSRREVRSFSRRFRAYRVVLGNDWSVVEICE